MRVKRELKPIEVKCIDCPEVFIAQEKIFPSYESPYKKEYKINGNSYKLSIHTGRYTYEEAKGQFYVSLWYDYNYKDHISRSVGGGSGVKLILDTFETFKESVNEALKRFPDYKEEEEPLFYEMNF